MEGIAGTVTMTAVVTMLVTWQWLRAASRWQRGRGLLGVKERVERENRERLYRAKADRAQGWRELWRSLAEFLIVLVIVVLVGFVLGGTVGCGGRLRRFVS